PPQRLAAIRGVVGDGGQRLAGGDAPRVEAEPEVAVGGQYRGRGDRGVGGDVGCAGDPALRGVGALVLGLALALRPVVGELVGGQHGHRDGGEAGRGGGDRKSVV